MCLSLNRNRLAFCALMTDKHFYQTQFWKVTMKDKSRQYGLSFEAQQSTEGDAFTEHGVVGKIFVARKYLVTPLVFKQQKWFLHQNGVEFNEKSKSDLTKLWPVVGR